MRPQSHKSPDESGCSVADLLAMSKLKNTDADHFHNDPHNQPRAVQMSHVTAFLDNKP